jgi:hypothetical protein
MPRKDKVGYEVQTHRESAIALNSQIEADITSSQPNERCLSPEPDPPEISPAFHPLDSIPANAEQEFRKRKPPKENHADSGKLHRVKHGIPSRIALNSVSMAFGSLCTRNEIMTENYSYSVASNWW